MDSGSTHGPPGDPLTSATIVLSVDEAYQLLLALADWSTDEEAGNADPEWHVHISDEDGNELTVAVDLEAG
jgi:hypothetical protein